MFLKSRLLASLAVLSLAACATTQQGASTDASGSASIEDLGENQAQAAPAPQLFTFGTPEDGFSAGMPGVPQVNRGTQPHPVAGQIPTALWVGKDSGIVYTLTTADYPEQFIASYSPASFLKGGIDDIVKALNGTITEQEDIQLNNKYPGKKFTVTSQDREVKGRSYLVGSRLYTLISLYSPGTNSPGIDAFLNSVTLINPPEPLQHQAPSTPAPSATPEEGATSAPATPPEEGATSAPTTPPEGGTP